MSIKCFFSKKTVCRFLFFGKSRWNIIYISAALDRVKLKNKRLHGFEKSRNTDSLMLKKKIKANLSKRTLCGTGEKKGNRKTHHVHILSRWMGHSFENCIWEGMTFYNPLAQRGGGHMRQRLTPLEFISTAGLFWCRAAGAGFERSNFSPHTKYWAEVLKPLITFILHNWNCLLLSNCYASAAICIMEVRLRITVFGFWGCYFSDELWRINQSDLWFI